MIIEIENFVASEIKQVVLDTPEEIALLMGLLSISPEHLEVSEQIAKLNHTVGKRLWQGLIRYEKLDNILERIK